LGITGAPGAGKSTLAEQLVSALAPRAVLVPMDGFHLAEAELKRLGIHDRKGAIDTFDVAGYVTLLRRLRAATEPVVYAPTFRRDLEEAIAGAIRVERDVPLVITEGNYLLVADGEWAEVRGLLDDVWYLAPEEEVRLDRLVRRHIDFGRDSETAAARAHGTDQRNADLVQTTRIRADLVVRGH
jgi:pantothenate kinase